MTVNLTFVALVAVLYAVGFFLLMDRSLTRLLLGVLVLGNATNLLLLSASGPAGYAPILGLAPTDEMADPLAQAMILTAIVITLGMAAFVLALIHRNWQLGQEGREEGALSEPIDEVVDDEEDRRIALLAAQDEVSGTHGDDGDEPDDQPGDHAPTAPAGPASREAPAGPAAPTSSGGNEVAP